MKRAIIIPDIHAPFHDKKSLRAVEYFMADKTQKWDYYVNLGDLMDFDQLSSFNKEKLRKLEGRNLFKDYEIANEILDRHQDILLKKNPDTEFALLEGNHEERIERLLDKEPNFQGIMEVEIRLRLKERNIRWIRCWTQRELYRIGKLYFTHGDYLSKYHAHKMVEAYGINIAYGHTHDIQNHTKTFKRDNKSQTIMGQSCGYLADPNKLDYIKNRPTNWTQAVAVAEFQDNGNFNLVVISIINHQFSYNGTLYTPKGVFK